ncbi:MAG: tRNA preQ1(34) S-adenosylmethionine ribosyltransferase-isomerase QueA [Coriobacteriia bacterium]|nr:tRNA preQ1(34) S-adenosylmethionine ribosyltransferase-isomerase QueA [Coriobacteriia bacterium]
MHTDDFDYELPSGSIAQSPTMPRDNCRMLVLDRHSGVPDHRVFRELPEYLRPGDVLVVNETKVLPARLLGNKVGVGADAGAGARAGTGAATGAAIEVLLLRERYSDAWECLVRPGRKLMPGAKVVFGDGALTGLIVEQTDESGGRLIQFQAHGTTFIEAVHLFGQTPLPPYITRPLENEADYQTMFAKNERSAAAPTAGLHFTPELVSAAEGAGASVVPVELDIGLDTFRPVGVADPEEHPMHTEHFRVSEVAAEAINGARASGGRVIAVGTTSVRAIESAFDDATGLVAATAGWTNLFILPGYSFAVTDAMITNFHMPRSTLLMMVSAFAGRKLVLRAYAEAIAEGYRLLSFGDAMFIY